MKKIILWFCVFCAAAIAAYLVSPFFFDKEVNESFPVSEREPQDTVNLVEVPDQELLDAMSDEVKMALEQSIVQRMADIEPIGVAEAMEEVSGQPPSLLASGTFQNADSFHKGSGKALLYRLPDGEHIIRFEDFEVTNGPDLHVWLVPNGVASSSDVGDDYVNLGRLKGNKGSQNYVIPSDVDMSKYKSVIIWCRAFSVLFSSASLS